DRRCAEGRSGRGNFRPQQAGKQEKGDKTQNRTSHNKSDDFIAFPSVVEWSGRAKTRSEGPRDMLGLETRFGLSFRREAVMMDRLMRKPFRSKFLILCAVPPLLGAARLAYPPARVE